jgi:hypothetical protein
MRATREKRNMAASRERKNVRAPAKKKLPAVKNRDRQGKKGGESGRAGVVWSPGHKCTLIS